VEPHSLGLLRRRILFFSPDHLELDLRVNLFRYVKLFYTSKTLSITHARYKLPT